ncbi:2,4-dienoyl-CoA reductase-like NADH-dependent reductase (Old Yellow Enzyme family) [Bacillus horti]|uniref:2,4-dienoyl-CoA reductase-like NADH-dependent reductase (Old Yellow Enzyme family) n=1 Tax=Caldalkalibacillus horti TaxID=77523 RepID=A0ABT9VXV2_9BACI|nr:2,4-dienoyl-CoA reductase-like NADH-dependent reductase (Old Yellow Enzyme family) [Bacillus horti]
MGMIANEALLKPVKLGAWHLRNRVVMAPMTRCFADDITGVVGEDVVEYYRKRAEDGIGLIITEGIIISPRAKGTIGVPGLYSKDQIEGWRRVTDAVHKAGGTIIAQLWHVGRLTHHEIAGGLPPQAPSAIAAKGHVHRFGKPFEKPEEMSISDIHEVIDQFALAARHAMLAGFDGVEVHGAHGYLIDQFNSDISNHRKDGYGGSLRQRLTFMKEVLQGVVQEVGAERTSIRFSALKDDQPDYMWDNPVMSIKEFLNLFRELDLSVIHPSTNHFNAKIDQGKTLHEIVQENWEGSIIGVGNLTPAKASHAIKKGTINLAAFGRPLLANSDFINKLVHGKQLTPYDSKHLSSLF